MSKRPAGRYQINRQNSVSTEDIANAQKEILEQDPTEFVPAQIRNILFCGASKSGKTTVFKILQNSCYCPEEISIFSDTKFTNFRTFSLRDRASGNVHNFVVNLIDTPGTFEVRSTKDEFEKRSNSEISDLIISCINHEVTYLNLLVLVLNSFKFSEMEMDSIDLFLNLFGKTKIPIVLCLTHADKIGESRREKIEIEITKHPRLEKYFALGIFDILWMGCVNHSQKAYIDIDTMKTDYMEVANWRDAFVDKIFSARKKVSLKTTDMFKSRKIETWNCLRQVSEFIDNLDKLDFKNITGNQQLELLQHTSNMNFLFQHAFYMHPEKKEKEVVNENGSVNGNNDQEEEEAENIVEEEEDPEQVRMNLDLYHKFHVKVAEIKDNKELPEIYKKQILGEWFK